MHTEAEAKKLWCPLARVGSAYGSTYNREFAAAGSIPDSGYCIGSACMAWRQAYQERGPIVERIEAAPGSKKPDGENWGYEARDPHSPTMGGDWVRVEPGEIVGFCGAFGRPE